jgi:hypothetical protein
MRVGPTQGAAPAGRSLNPPTSSDFKHLAAQKVDSTLEVVEGVGLCNDRCHSQSHPRPLCMVRAGTRMLWSSWPSFGPSTVRALPRWPRPKKTASRRSPGMLPSRRSGSSGHHLQAGWPLYWRPAIRPAPSQSISATWVNGGTPSGSQRRGSVWIQCRAPGLAACPCPTARWPPGRRSNGHCASFDARVESRGPGVQTVVELTGGAI